MPWLKGKIRPAITWQWAEGAVPLHGRQEWWEQSSKYSRKTDLKKERIGVDNIDMASLAAFQKAGVNIVDGWARYRRSRRQDR